MAEVSRVFQGLQIEGERIAVSVQPVDEWSGDGGPTLVLGVDARSSEWADWANMTADQVYKFTRDEIALARTTPAPASCGHSTPPILICRVSAAASPSRSSPACTHNSGRHCRASSASRI
ncbi:hypothetical protein AB4Y42_39040 [Paraburkholderia sp. EG286B]|uniref:hypothetical protein n=1 Tax=Paraburkholderia sp. EG286B TaxID=3237011 RepID=UPI0034D15EC9